MRIKLSEALDGQAALRLQFQSQMNKHQTSLNEMKNVHVSIMKNSECFSVLCKNANL